MTESSNTQHSHVLDDAIPDGDGEASRLTTPVTVAGAAAIASFAARGFTADLGPETATGALPHLDPGSLPKADLPRPKHVDPPRYDKHPQPNRACARISAKADASLFTSMNHYWQNWPKTHAFVARMMCFPTSVDEVGAAVRLAEQSSLPLRAVGGGWSFSDAALPGTVTTTRPDVATADELARWLPLAEGFRSTGPSVAVVDSTDPTLIGFDDHDRSAPALAIPGAAMLDFTLGGTQPAEVCLVNTRSLKSSLQERLDGILSAAAKQGAAQRLQEKTHYFHVEGGITIEELAPLLDAQSPRLALEASGGNPGATLAGTISTGTHGAEFNTPLLVDRVKAIHLVGPGGLQWWIEGDDPIADPDALVARYPCLDRTRIISGTNRVLGATPQDWLNAVVVSMGSMGVIYSIVVAVTELSGMREVMSQTTWWRLLPVAEGVPVPVDPQGKPIFPVLQSLGLAGENQLRIPATNPGLSASIVKVITDGSFSGKIPPGENVYADLAFNPNRRKDGDLDCWIVNRNAVAVPFDRQPPAPDGMADVATAIFGAMSDAFGGNVGALVDRLGRVYGFIDPTLGALNQLFNPAGPILNTVLQGLVPGPAGVVLGQMLMSGNPAPLVAMIDRIGKAHDTLDVALNEVTKPMSASQATDLAQPFLSGILAATLGTAKTNPGIAVGTSVGNVGFPDQGLVGAGLEVAMPEAAAFPFIQTEILDRMLPQLPFFGYVSIRICPKTDALLGMPQWDRSVMVEVVSFGDNWGRTFMTILQTRITSLILTGKLDAMLHWGLENDQLAKQHLQKIPALGKPTPCLAEDPGSPGVPLDRISAFKHIRDAIRAAGGRNPSSLFRAFDNALTTRLGL